MEKSTNSGDLNFPWRIAVELRSLKLAIKHGHSCLFLLRSQSRGCRSLAGGGGEEGCAGAPGLVQIILVIFW